MIKIVVALLGLVVLLGASYTGLPIATTNSIMKLYPSWQYFSVLRLGVNSIGDAPPQWFVPSETACSISGGDVGSEVPTNDGGCFNAVAVPGETVDVREWGTKGDGVSNDSTAIQAAAAFLGANGGGNVFIPPTGAAYVIDNGISLLAGVHLVGAGGLNWTSPIDNTESHWTNKSSWLHCEDTVNPCISIVGNSSSVEGLNFWYTQPTPTASACGAPCTYVHYTWTTYPYTIVITGAVSDWVINDSIVNASHCVDWEGPTNGIAGIYSGMDRDNFGCFNTGTKFHRIDNTLNLSRLRYEMWWFQGNAQWWYAMQGAGTHVDWDIEYLANPQVSDVEFSFGGTAMKFTNATVTSGFGNITFAVSDMQAKGVSFNENCQGIVVAASTTAVTAQFTDAIAYSDSTTSPISGQCARAAPYFFDLNSDAVNVTFNGLEGGLVQSLAFIGGGNVGSVHGQLHFRSNSTVQDYSAYSAGNDAVDTDSTGSYVDFGQTPLFFPSQSPLAGNLCGGAGCQSNANSFIGQLEIGGVNSTTRQIIFSEIPAANPVGVNLGLEQWGLRNDTNNNLDFDRFATAGTYSDTPVQIQLNNGQVNFNDAVQFSGTAGNVKVNGVSGVSCTGAPTASFASSNGVVTHC